MARDGHSPRSMIVITSAGVCSQCARALIRSALWSPAAQAALPTVGDMLADSTAGGIDSAAYDAAWCAGAAATLW